MKQIIILIASILISGVVSAQHDHTTHDHGLKKDTVKAQAAPKRNTSKPASKAGASSDTLMDPSRHDHGVQPTLPTHSHDAGAHHDMKSHQHGAPMSHGYSKNLPMTRNGSGTSWLPDNSPMYGYMFHSGKWMYMLHGNTFLKFNKQDLFDRGSRGGKKFDAPDMWMFMGQRAVGSKGLFHFSTMFSLDPILVGKSGYPLLFQTGESYKGRPLIDRQHPHDLFSELAVSYSYSFNKNTDLFLYVGYPGEPALGPAAYVHRPSGFLNPDAPLTHHWVDATHITFGVATLGLRLGNVKIEGSSFTGREPDENRYDFDKPRFDSWSGRLSYNLTQKWAFQVSHGFIKEPELLHPGENVNRTTASAQFSSRGFGESFTNVTALWGMNKTKDHKGENGILLEASHQQRKTAIYGRYEWVEKSAEELGFEDNEFGHDAVFPTHTFTAGASYDLLTLGQTKIGIGGQLTFYNPDKRLVSIYGDNPVAGQVYIRIYPRAMGTKAGRLYLPY